MRFLPADESRAYEKRIWRQLGDSDGRPGSARSSVYHGSNPQYAAAGRAIAGTVAPFTSAMLLFLGTPFGDGSDRLNTTYPVWRDFYAWRASRGGGGRLYETPGHECGHEESEELATLIAFALELGWDALLAVRPGRNVLWMSHDDRIDFHVGFKHRALTEALKKLGFCLSA